MRAHVVLVLALAACDPQADGGYPGEAIAVLPGSVASPGGVVVDGMEIYWQDVDPRGPGALRSPVPVRTRFPGGFEASLIAPPPSGALMQFDGGGFELTYDGDRLATWTENDGVGTRRTTYAYCD